MRERLKEFFEVYEFYLKTGIWSTTSVYGIMNEAYQELQPGPKKKKLNTGCSGCITSVAKQIYDKWH